MFHRKAREKNFQDIIHETPRITRRIRDIVRQREIPGELDSTEESLVRFERLSSELAGQLASAKGYHRTKKALSLEYNWGRVKVRYERYQTERDQLEEELRQMQRL